MSKKNVVEQYFYKNSVLFEKELVNVADGRYLFIFFYFESKLLIASWTQSLTIFK